MRPVFDRLKRLRAESAPDRHGIEHALETDLIGRVVQEAQRSQRVLNLGALIEANATDDPVADIALSERFLQHTALRRRAVHDGDIAHGASRNDETPDFVDDEPGLVVLVG